MNLKQFDNPKLLFTWDKRSDTDQLKDEYRAFYGLPSEKAFHYNAGYIKVNNLQIYVQTWQPAIIKKTIFIVHGYFDHTGLYGHIIRFFLEHSYAVLIFDLPGHGLSSGERHGIENFSVYSDVLQHCLAHANNKLPKPWCLFGQSTGAAIITNSILINHITSVYNTIDQIILLAPLVKIIHWKYSKIMCRLLSPFVKTVKRKKSKNLLDPAFATLLKKDPLQYNRVALSWVRALYKWVDEIHQSDNTTSIPTLIIQGERDKTVDWSYNVAFLSALFCSSELFLLPQAFHNLVNEPLSVRHKYYAKLTAWLSP
ncbi:MAG: alpha/beta hydrolase [Endozoicomonadaceae bacterium]|nr:alpha/beta hydrolase [Endozoicomonadaceae bacterium]MCY4329964.1 alpha/beta hydrolase [Endozoicomonadaceae bacterium]